MRAAGDSRTGRVGPGAAGRAEPPAEKMAARGRRAGRGPRASRTEPCELGGGRTEAGPVPLPPVGLAASEQGRGLPRGPTPPADGGSGPESRAWTPPWPLRSAEAGGSTRPGPHVWLPRPWAEKAAPGPRPGSGRCSSGRGRGSPAQTRAAGAVLAPGLAGAAGHCVHGGPRLPVSTGATRNSGSCPAPCSVPVAALLSEGSVPSLLLVPRLTLLVLQVGPRRARRFESW